jgi:hypothetical protein
MVGGNGNPSGRHSLSELSRTCERCQCHHTIRTCCGVQALKEAIYMDESYHEWIAGLVRYHSNSTAPNGSKSPETPSIWALLTWTVDPRRERWRKDSCPANSVLFRLDKTFPADVGGCILFSSDFLLELAPILEVRSLIRRVC